MENKIPMSVDYPTQKYVGYIRTGSSDGLCLWQKQKPNTFRRFFLKLLLGFEWVDDLDLSKYKQAFNSKN